MTQIIPEVITKLSGSVGAVVAKNPSSGEYSIGTGFVAYQDNIIASVDHDDKPGFIPVAFLTKDYERYSIAQCYTPELCQGVRLWKTYKHTGLNPLSCAAAAEERSGDTLYTIGLINGEFPIISRSLFHRAPEGRDRFYMFAALTPGSCGSPVIDSSGKVIGVYRARRLDRPEYQIVTKIQYYNTHMGYLQSGECEWEWAFDG